MNEIATKKTVTTRELAETLGVDRTTVTKTVKRLEQGGEVLHHSTTDEFNNTIWWYDEQQATIIKQEIQKHHNLATRQIDTVSTELEENQTIANAMMILQRRSEELKRRAEIAEKQVEEMKPKAIVYDEFVERERFCNFRDGANYLHISQSDLMNLLKSRYIYKNSAGEYRHYSEYSQYFALRPFTLGNKTKQQLMFTIKGLEFFKNKINSTKRVEA